MASEIEARAAEIKHTAASRVLVEYLQFKLDKNKNNLMIAKSDMFIQLQGRAQELQDLITFFSEKK